MQVQDQEIKTEYDFEFQEEEYICKIIKAIVVDCLKELNIYKDDSLIYFMPGQRSWYVSIGINLLCSIQYRKRSKYLEIKKDYFEEFKGLLPTEYEVNNIPSNPFVRIVLNSPDDVLLYKDFIFACTKKLLDHTPIWFDRCNHYTECSIKRCCVNPYKDIISGCNYCDQSVENNNADCGNPANDNNNTTAKPSIHIKQHGVSTKIEINFGALFKEKPIRSNKGNNLIDFPDDYVVLDTETTGLDPRYDEIIEVSAIKYSNNKEIDRFSTLINPGHEIDEFIIELTGITNEMLAQSPDGNEVFPKFKDFIGNSILIGHNVNFDINFLYDKYENEFQWNLSNDFIDTMRLSRRLHPEIRHHRLSDVTDRYGIEYTNAHRALNDCAATAQCYWKIREEVLDNYPCFEKFIEICKKQGNAYNNECHKTIKELCDQNRNDEELEKMNVDHSNPFFNKTVVFTGTLATVTRAEAMQMVLNCGGKCWDSVTKETNYLVLGNNDYCSSIKDGKSNKQKKAEQLKLKGQDIEIISENVFWDLLKE